MVRNGSWIRLGDLQVNMEIRSRIIMADLGAFVD